VWRGTLARVKVVRQDKLYLAFLAVSCAGFSSLAARELVALQASREQTRKATSYVKECATMLDLQKAGLHTRVPFHRADNENSYCLDFLSL
jgi:hypothetical protein